MKNNLKSCPFCKSNKVIVTWYPFDKNYFYVECENCGAKTDEYYCEEKAIEAWNKRYDNKTYIDADELFKCKTCFHNRNGGCDTYCDHGESYRPAFGKLRKITNIQEVKHGKWVDNGWEDYVKICSCCGRSPLSKPNGNPYYSKYCPNCGAKMDGK